jgi:hypothetical protein
MGCDIHIVLERRHSEREPWIGVVAFDAIKVSKRPPADDRYYEFFAAIAGVRGPGPKPLGMPPDMSELSRVQCSEMGTDGHSHSYLPAADFCERFRRASDGKDSDDEILGVYMESDEQWRVVFWFDN